MATIASLQVLLSAQTAKFDAALKASEKRTQKFAATAKSALSSIGVGLSAAAAVGFLKSSFAAFEKDQKAVRKLESVLRSTGGAAGFTSAQLRNMASDLQKVTNFGDETTVAAQAVLATFTQIRGDVFRDAIVAAQNMSAVLEQDLQSSVIQLGKALNDPIKGITALRRVGVSFTQQQMDVIKSLVESGKVMEAQKVILAELNVEFGGAAEATRNFSTSVANDFDDLKEAIGGVAGRIAGDGSVISDAIQSITARLNAFNDALDRTKSLGETLEAVFRLIDPGKIIGEAIAKSAMADTIKTLEESAKPGELTAKLAAEAAAAAAPKEAVIDPAVAKQAEKLTERVNKLTESLGEELETFGMTTRAAELHKLALSGATAAQIAQARTLAVTLDAMEKQVEATKKASEEREKLLEETQRKQEELAEAGKSVFESVRTPLEEYADEVERLNKLLEAGAISQETFDRAARKAREGLVGDKKDEASARPDTFSPARPQALILGTAAAFSASLGSGDRMARITADRIARATEGTEEQVRRLHQVLRPGRI